jgi:hypothetical protein
MGLVVIKADSVLKGFNAGETVRHIFAVALNAVTCHFAE